MLSNPIIPLVQHTPRFDNQTAVKIVERLYGLRATASSLPSERDQNFLLTTDADKNYVFKIANTLENRALLLAQCNVMTHLSNRGSLWQSVVPSVAGNILEEVESPNGTKHFVRLLTYLEGKPLALTTQPSSKLLRDLGRKLGTMDLALFDFDDPAVHRDFHWDLKNGVGIVDSYLSLVQDARLREGISNFVTAFERDTAPFLANLRQSVIYGDANDYNILVRRDASAISGFIDFGDIVYSYTVGDLAIAVAYVVLRSETPLESARFIVAGYQEVVSLAGDEISALWQLVLMRLSMSACIAAFQMHQRPDNQYLDISQSAIVSKLPGLLRIDREAARLAFVNRES